jgi:apolipoprotein N-acyltransferase
MTRKRPIAWKEVAGAGAAFGITAALLTLIQSPFSLGYLAWIALVPFVWVCDSTQPTRRLISLSFLISSIYWLGNIYWISYVTIPAYILFCLYLALYWPIMVWGFRYLHGRWQMPYFIAVPLMVLGSEAWQGILITGFDWRLLAHSQYGNYNLIQIADIFGATGISLIIAMANGLVADLVIDARQLGLCRVIRWGNVLKMVVMASLLVSAVFYGRYRIRQTEDCLHPGPIIGAVQPNIPSIVKELNENGQAILEDLIRQSAQAYSAGAHLLAWPETIVLTTLNAGFVAYCREDSNPVIFDKMIREFVKDKGHLIAGAHAADLVFDEAHNPHIMHKYNSAFLYRSNGIQEPRRYDKIHLVPFGEYIPFRDRFPWLDKLILSLSPYDYDYHLTQGTQHTVFEIEADKQQYRFGALICYEDTDAQVARKNVVDPAGHKMVDWLVDISNDGWYVRYKNGKVFSSTELPQRTIITAFRAIENRTWILRSVNTGISCLIDSTGRIHDGFLKGNLPETTLARQAVAGWFVDQVRIDPRVTFFSRQGPWLKNFFAAIYVLVIILGISEFCLRVKPRG